MRGRAWREGDEREGKMRTICDVCESAPAVLFCAADEAALCRPCDEKVLSFRSPFVVLIPFGIFFFLDVSSGVDLLVHGDQV
ncbi:hypothetical protein GW17_00051239 [Ensete ventricosum]|nr:hypothetical protein GW17_00051239 [Ensete ventricosum]RZS09302.1 hypothetical protein BHM03_00040372 [Ensete ventricosum]